MEETLAVVGILVDNRAHMGPEVQKVLTEHGSIIMARMGLPSCTKHEGLITLSCMGNREKLEHLTSSLSDLSGVSVGYLDFA